MQGIKIRVATPNDMAMIYSSWMKSNRKNGMAADVLNEVYFDEHRKVIEGCFNRGEIYVACDSENTDVIIGYMAASKDVLHYVYVKHMFRKLKVAETLVRAVFPDFGNSLTVTSHVPRNAQTSMVKFKLCYNPYLIMGA
jgi:hypothetical protein